MGVRGYGGGRTVRGARGRGGEKPHDTGTRGHGDTGKELEGASGRVGNTGGGEWARGGVGVNPAPEPEPEPEPEPAPESESEPVFRV